jgi:hypothetical protein
MTKYYFYSEGKNKIGPLTFDEIKNLRLKEDAMIWHEGLPNWINATEDDELKPFLISLPPQLPSEIEDEVIKNAIEKESSGLISEGVIVSFLSTFLLTGIAIFGATLESNSSLSDAFPVYLSRYEKEHPEELFIKFLPYTFVLGVIIGFIFYFKSRNNTKIKFERKVKSNQEVEQPVENQNRIKVEMLALFIIIFIFLFVLGSFHSLKK